MGILPGVLDRTLYMKACQRVEDQETCMTMKEREEVLLRMVEAGVTPNEVSAAHGGGGRDAQRSELEHADAKIC